MKRLLSIPLRVLLPVLLLSCGALAGLISWQLNTRLLAGEIESQFLDEARLRITGLQAALEYHFRKGDADGVGLAMSGMATRNDVIAGFVLDREDRVLAATRIATVGGGAEAIVAELPGGLKGGHAAQVARVRASANGVIVLSMNRRVAVAYYPLLVDVDDHALRPVRNGLVVLVFDMQLPKTRALQAVGRQALKHALVFGGLTALAWVFIHFSLTRRVAALVATTRQLALGNLSARTGMQGGDELAQVGQALDLMADRVAEDIRRRQQVEAKLRESELRFREMAENIQQVFWMVTPSGEELIYVSPAFEQILGRTCASIHADPLSWMDAIVPEDRPAAAADFGRAANGEAFDSEFRIARPDGSLRWIHDRGFPVRDLNGKVVRLCGIAKDITARKDAEIALKQSQKRLRDLIDGVGPSMFVGLMTPQGILIECNQPALVSAGLKPEDVLGKPFEKTHWWAHSPEAQQQLREAIARAARGEASRYDVQTRGVGNQLIDIDFSLQPLRDETGEVVFLVPSGNVITERKQIENALRESKRFAESIAENSTNVIYLFDLETGRSTYTNRNAAEALGYSHAQILEMGANLLPTIIHPEDLARVAQHLAQFADVSDNRIIDLEYRMKHASGATRWIWGRDTVFNRRPNGAAWQILGTAQDITERKQAEAALVKAHRELVDASRLAGRAEVATSVLHNVGNVLNSVNISADVVVDNVKKSKASNLAKVVSLLREHDHDLGMFITSDPRGKHVLAHLAQLSDQLMSEQKAIVGELELLRGNIEHIKEIVAMQQNYATVGGVREMANMVDLVEDSMRLNEEDLSRQSVQVTRDFQKVPLMNVEKHKVVQILVNLLRNAKHACQDSDRAHKRLTVRVANGHGRVKISVIDNGVGISAENLTRIYNFGFTTRKNGHGFGLHSGALAAKEMGGSLTAQSDGIGQGATFTLELPCPAPVTSGE